MDIFFIALTLLMLLVIYFDITSYTIPNWLNGIVLVLFPAMAILTPATIDWQSALTAFGIVFVIGFVIFALNWMGGGDIKLFIATAPWIGFPLLLNYLLLVAILGGILSVFLWSVRKPLPLILSSKTNANLPKLFQDGAPAPYGLAIAGAFLYFMCTKQIIGITPAFAFTAQ